MAEKSEDEILRDLVSRYRKLAKELEDSIEDTDRRIARLEAYFDSLPAWLRRLTGWSKAKRR